MTKANAVLNYVEYAAVDLEATKSFFSTVFGWQFIDYGKDYTAFSDVNLDGGFYRANKTSISQQGGALLVFKTARIAQVQHDIELAGGVISKALFSFPGGHRFHFIEPSGNEFAVWSESL